MNKKYFLVIILLLFTSFSNAQDNIIEQLLFQNRNLFSEVLNNLDSFEIQIIYTQIDRDKKNFPIFTTHKFKVDPKKYFYPASTVKLPLAILALEKLNDLNIEGLNKYTPLKIDSLRKGQSSVSTDSSSENYLPSIANYIKKIFLVSDNDAYNRLYEFVGQKEINSRLHKRIFTDLKIVHRFVGGLSADDNRHTNQITFYNKEKIIYEQKEQFNEESYSFNLNNLYKGIGYLNANDSLINQSFDFSAKNYISLETLTEILKSIIFPESVHEKQRFNLTEDDYKFLYKYMSMLPNESKHPCYDSTYYDSYVKYFIFGDSKTPIKKNIRIFNKVGMAYGFLTDVAYIIDKEKKVEFMLSTVIHVNKNKIYNDGIYEYQDVGLPFLSNLGKVIYDYEQTRKKKHLPTFEKFSINYN